MIQQAILQILTPIFDPEFSESSFGFRPGRSAHGALKQIQQTIREGYRHCVDMDLSKFFDRVQHDVLMTRVARKVHDKRLLKLIGRYLRAGVMVEGVIQPSAEGTMQGGPLSPNKWLRRRVRACYWKWWRKPKTKIRKLLALGVRLDEAVSHGCSRKGPWRMSGSRGFEEVDESFFAFASCNLRPSTSAVNASIRTA